MISRVSYSTNSIKKISFAGDSQKVSPELWQAMERTKITLERIKNEVDLGFSRDSQSQLQINNGDAPWFSLKVADNQGKYLRVLVIESPINENSGSHDGVNTFKVEIHNTNPDELLAGYMPAVSSDVMYKGKTYKKGSFIKSFGDTPQNQRILIDCLTKANDEVTSVLDRVYSREAKESGSIYC
ncbi:MAG: hypothetical protein LBK53_06690 [Heliobacteriaceae bacterium]|jgi:hypothetical protein|nr:hypothetical protein [Heliobacteriaceae bacterium]